MQLHCNQVQHCVEKYLQPNPYSNQRPLSSLCPAKPASCAVQYLETTLSIVTYQYLQGSHPVFLRANPCTWYLRLYLRARTSDNGTLAWELSVPCQGKLKVTLKKNLFFKSYQSNWLKPRWNHQPCQFSNCEKEFWESPVIIAHSHGSCQFLVRENKK